MARKKVTDSAPALESWDAVDKAICEIGVAQRNIEAVQNDMQDQITQLKLVADKSVAPHVARISELEKMVKHYVEHHRDEMGGKKTKELTFGRAGFRQSTRLALPKAKERLAEIMLKLKVRGMHDCIVQPPAKINREVLRTKSAYDVRDVGAELVVEDAFWYEVDREKLPQK